MVSVVATMTTIKEKTKMSCSACKQGNTGGRIIPVHPKPTQKPQAPNTQGLPPNIKAKLRYNGK